MGMNIGFSSSHFESLNPNPYEYTILSSYWDKENNNSILFVQYNGCTNFEGCKILVYKNKSVSFLLTRKKLDPHFAKTGLAPFARFEPTQSGMEAAIKLLRVL